LKFLLTNFSTAVASSSPKDGKAAVV